MYKRLQNGSDVRGIAVDGEDTVWSCSPSLAQSVRCPHMCSPQQGYYACAGVEGEARNITPTVAFFIGAGLAEMLAKREGVPTTSLRISVGAPATD